MFFTKAERPDVMKRLLNKELLEDMFDQVRKKYVELRQFENTIDISRLPPEQQLIVKSRQATLDELSVFMGIIEATVFNVAEQNETLTKLIQMYSSTESQQKAIRNELLEKIDSQQKELEKRNNNNDPFIQNLKKYYDKMSETTKE